MITSRVSRRRREMYSGHGRLCVFVSVSVCVSVCLYLAAFPHYCTDLYMSWGNGRRYHLVVHYWTDLQSLHGFRCYDNITPNAKCQRVVVFGYFVGWDRGN